MKNAANRFLTVAAICLLALLIMAWHKAFSRDLDGRYAQSENHEWVKSLHSPAGAWCCDISDGRTLVDADWQTKSGHYQVKREGVWLDVPEDSVITQPNKIGQTIVWFGWRDGNIFVMCFLPGSMT